ncbi:major facilitator superfamily protein [Sarocladium implicatum]|nr:major facilitator superfamily protein [Sarocladium implicatum]
MAASKETIPCVHVNEPETSTTLSSDPSNIETSTENRPWYTYIWDTWDKSPEERRLIRKIDCTLVLFGMLGTFSKFIDRANLQTAYVSGMKEELQLFGNELNYANTAYNVGMIVALWPSSLLLVRTNPRFYIPGIQLGWTICTFGQAFMHTPTQMYALRALTGIFSTGHYSGIMYLGGCWYRKSELAKRLALMNTSSQIGPMVNSYLQSAAYVTLTGKNGLSGWRWLMLLDGLVSTVILIPQFFLLSEVPSKLRPDFMFSQAECELARNRMPQEAEVRVQKLTWKQVSGWFILPNVWILWIISVCNMIGMQPSISLSFWFKAWNEVRPGSFTVPQINNYTTPFAGDPATRAFALAGLNVWGSVAVATIPLAVFKIVDQPAVVNGNYTAAAFLLLQAFLALVLAYRTKKDTVRSHGRVDPQETDKAQC